MPNVYGVMHVAHGLYLVTYAGDDQTIALGPAAARIRKAQAARPRAAIG